MEWTILNAQGLLTVVTTVISVAAAVAALFPQAEGANGVIAQIRKVVDVLALNFGHATNQVK